MPRVWCEESRASTASAAIRSRCGSASSVKQGGRGPGHRVQGGQPHRILLVAQPGRLLQYGGDGCGVAGAGGVADQQRPGQRPVFGRGTARGLDEPLPYLVDGEEGFGEQHGVPCLSALASRGGHPPGLLGHATAGQRLEDDRVHGGTAHAPARRRRRVEGVPTSGRQCLEERC
ncbi:hypothetical protein ACRJ4W_24200 [Streptomyces sp. GLT-R25]